MMFFLLYDSFILGGDMKKQIIRSSIATLVAIGITIAFNKDNIVGVLPLISLIIAINIMSLITSYVAMQKKSTVVIALCGIITALFAVAIIVAAIKLIF